MTESDAIKVLKMVETHGSLTTKAKDMAIKALEKQIAKKPILDKVYICPTCKSEMYCEPDYMQLHFNYCTECGQKLDWE